MAGKNEATEKSGETTPAKGEGSTKGKVIKLLPAEVSGAQGPRKERVAGYRVER